MEQLEDIIVTYRGIRPPNGLDAYHALVLKALEHQRAVLSEWEAAGADFSYRDRIGQHKMVQAASRALRQAYSALMARYSASESTHNRDALFDYHCALDFL